MKKWIWYVAIIAAVAFLSGKSSVGTDVGKLQPVQVVRVASRNGWVMIETDTGDLGVGETLKTAFEDLKQSASAEVFLDTADYLIIGKDCEELLPSLMKKLRPSCAVCIEDGEPDLEQVGVFLEYHKPEVTLMRYKAGESSLPTLQTEEGRMTLVS